MNRIPTVDVLTQEQVERIDAEVMRILTEVGCDFEYEPALEVFRGAGVRVEGNRVFLTEDFIRARLAEAPSEFTLAARNAALSTPVHDGSFILTPSYGPPFVYEIDGECRITNSTDYNNVIKLTHMSENINHTGHNVVEMQDYPDEIRHLKMIESHIKYSDKAFMGATHGEVCAQDTVDMCKIIFGLDDEGIKKTPILNSLINSITPLKFDERMLGSMMVYAKYGQSNMISSLVMSGSTGPISMVETLALQLAETIAGLCLCQIINPGTPVILGSTSGPADMATMALSIGNAEVGLYTAATAQMGRFYDVPTRGGGGLNDSISPDAQAGYEAMMTLMSPAIYGTAFILHAAGIMHYYNAFSYEKFIIDDEIAGMCNKFIQGYNFSDDRFLFEDVEEVGPGGHFLYQDSTLDFARDHRRPLISNRGTIEAWDEAGRRTAAQVAKERYEKQLAEYQRPELDSAVEAELNEFITKRCNELIGEVPELYV